jgi:hypothetical protein
MTLWAITSYFNPARYRTRAANYKVFREHLGVPLLTVEHAVDGRFELAVDAADRLVQLSGGDPLWQKERLLNVALDALPAECDAVAWLDCDVVLADRDWPERASAALEQYALVQPFARAREVRAAEFRAAEFRAAEFGAASGTTTVRPSFAQRYATGRLGEEHLRTWRDGTDPVPLHCGYGWVARTATMRRYRFYDGSILGGGTRELATTAIGRLDHLLACRPRNPYQVEHLMAWAHPFAGYVDGAIGYLDGDACHLWHGDVANRGYGTRYQILATLDFDPARDIAHDGGGWRWASDKPQLHREVATYFHRRGEDG